MEKLKQCEDCGCYAWIPIVKINEIVNENGGFNTSIYRMKCKSCGREIESNMNVIYGEGVV